MYTNISFMLMELVKHDGKDKTACSQATVRHQYRALELTVQTGNRR